MSNIDRYRAAGVDLDAAAEAKRRIKVLVASTKTALTRGVAGAFGGMVKVPDGMKQPVLVMSTDGVGTKVLVALRAGKHTTVGEDLVNHSVNDILVHGAVPIAFLDYIAGADLTAGLMEQLVEGVARACKRHAMTLAGGETAQMPDVYVPGHYDLAGTIVGVVEESKALHGDKVQAGDAVVGYASSGLHTNGYTLARKVIFDELGLDVGATFPETRQTVGDVLLAVHRSYYSAIHPVIDSVHALAHITGGGIEGNLVRVLPEGLGARIDKRNWQVPAVFTVIRAAGHVDEAEMYRVFNMGIGMIAVVPQAKALAVHQAATNADVKAMVLGHVVKGSGVRLE